MFGVDEAGRGPVLGSMFVGCVSTDASSLPSGLKDSKDLSDTEREDFAQTLHTSDAVNISVVEVPPREIDSEDDSLTELTVKAMGEAIRGVAFGDGFVDACHPDATTFEEMVKDEIHDSIDAISSVSAEHKADEEYPIVSAASIVAKQAREDHVSELTEEYGEVGSGYPSDPTTREFLERYVDSNGHLPEMARHSWSTCSKLAQEHGIASERMPDS